MDTKETARLSKSDNILLSDSNYYKFIFKKTEKIVCTVFYIIEHSDKGHNDPVSLALAESAKHALDSALKTLSNEWYAAYGDLYRLLYSLVALQSHGRVAQAAALLRQDVADVLSLEIDTVLRGLRQYLVNEKNGIPDLASFTVEDIKGKVVSPLPPQTRDVQKDRGRSGMQGNSDTSIASARTSVASFISSQKQPKGQHVARQQTIKDILSLNGQLTIKDIVEKMSDIGEKTIQREVIAMVNKGLVLKHGSKRWSRYSLVLGT